MAGSRSKLFKYLTALLFVIGHLSGQSGIDPTKPGDLGDQALNTTSSRHVRIFWR
jgi:hypothetical protein